MRGKLTKEIKKVSSDLLGYEITQYELRLMPYIQYCVMNRQNIDPAKVSSGEREILSSWREKNFISGGASDLEITKPFWDAISQILWLGYVNK
jgi:hypothetical protein